MFKIVDIEHRDDGDDTIYIELTLGDAIWSALIFMAIGRLIGRFLL